MRRKVCIALMALSAFCEMLVVVAGSEGLAIRGMRCTIFFVALVHFTNSFASTRRLSAAASPVDDACCASWMCIGSNIRRCAMLRSANLNALPLSRANHADADVLNPQNRRIHSGQLLRLVEMASMRRAATMRNRGRNHAKYSSIMRSRILGFTSCCSHDPQN